MAIKLNWTTIQNTFIFTALTGLIVFSTFVAYTKYKRTTYIKDLATSLQDIKQVRDGLGRILEPADIEAGQKDLSAELVVSQLRDLQKSYPSLHLPSELQVCASALPNLSCRDYGSAKQAAITSLADSRSAIQYHSEIMRSLLSVLEYNPEADLGDEALNQPTIDSRIKAANQGLERTRSGLIGTVGIDDERKTTLVQTVESLQQQLEQFTTNRDKAVWYKNVSDTQAAIIQNRQAFWQDQLSDKYKSLDQATIDLVAYKSATTR